MHQVETIAEWRKLRKTLDGRQIGYVPTMGFLHEGHLSLIKAAKEENDLVVMSIFVNPLQFGENEDYQTYPRDIERDRQLATEAGVDYLFIPTQQEMYPQAVRTNVIVREITECLCGESRPGHFDGVATVVSKLLNIIQPTNTYFGIKDAQQVAVLTQMVTDLNIPVQIKVCPIIRESDGLALSSRNVYLSVEEREQATVLYHSINIAEQLILEGERNVRVLKDKLKEKLMTSSLAQIDYIEIRSFPSLTEITSLDDIEGTVIIALAVKFGKTRLIDNKIIEKSAWS